MPIGSPAISWAIWLASFAFLGLLACAGGSGPSSPASAPGAVPDGATLATEGNGGGSPGGTVRIGGPLDGAVSAAQPLSGGFPAPSLEGDPSKDVYFYNSVEHGIECRDSQSGRFLFHMEAYVVPPRGQGVLSGRVLRWIEPVRKEFMDIVLQDKGGIVSEGDMGSDAMPMVFNYTGYFNARASLADPYALKSYLLPPNAAAESLDQFKPCAADPCYPPSSEVVEGGFVEESRFLAAQSVEHAVIQKFPVCSTVEFQREAPVRFAPFTRP